jgi:hypothetical protein
MKKLVTMTFLTFLISLVLIAAILLFIRIFWLEILIFYYILQILWWTLIAALLWIIFVSQTLEGWYFVWATIFLSFCGILAVVYCITVDAFSRFLSLVKSLLK